MQLLDIILTAALSSTRSYKFIVASFFLAWGRALCGVSVGALVFDSNIITRRPPRVLRSYVSNTLAVLTSNHFCQNGNDVCCRVHDGKTSRTRSDIDRLVTPLLPLCTILVSLMRLLLLRFPSSSSYSSASTPSMEAA